MKTVLGTTGLIAAALFLSAPNAGAATEGIALQDIGSGSAVSLSAGTPTLSAGGQNTDTELGLGSVGVGSSNPGGFYIDLGSVRVPLG